MSTTHTHGLVLSGGACYGAYEIGVMRALAGGTSHVTHPVVPHVIAGTSAGALNAALLCAHFEGGLSGAVDELERVWHTNIAETPGTCKSTVLRYRGSLAEFASPACFAKDPVTPMRQLASDASFILRDGMHRAARLLRGETQVGQRLLDMVSLRTIICCEPYHHLVKSVVPLAKIRGAKVQLRIAATNWHTGDVRVFENSDMTDEQGHDVILASSAIPGVFPSVRIGGVPYADGGLVMNTPLGPAIDAGAQVIHVVSVNPQIRLMKSSDLHSTIGEIYRALAVSLESAINRDVEIAARINKGIRILENAEKGIYDPSTPLANAVLTLGGQTSKTLKNLRYQQLTIHRYELADPGESFLSWLDFSPSRIQSLIQSGYNDTLKHDCKASGCVLPA